MQSRDLPSLQEGHLERMRRSCQPGDGQGATGQAVYMPVSAASGTGAAGESRPHRVLVFTTPSCPWCGRAKSYLREQGVRFREIDVSRDAAAARDLVRRSGQMGVPVIEIDGKPIVGFDRPKIDRLLGLRG